MTDSQTDSPAETAEAEPAAREPHVIPPMSPEEWNSFVAQVASGHAITSQQIEPDMLGRVFMPILLGGLSDWTKEELGQIGCLWESYDKAGERGINGYPCFFSVRMASKEDWERAVPEINRRRAVLLGEDPKEEA